MDLRLKSGSAVILGGSCIYNKTPLICIHNKKDHGYLSLNKVNYFLNCQDKNVYNHLDWKKCWLKVLILFYCRKVERIGMFCFKYKCDTCQFIVGKTELLFPNVLFLPENWKDGDVYEFKCFGCKKRLVRVGYLCRYLVYSSWFRYGLVFGIKVT